MEIYDCVVMVKHAGHKSRHRQGDEGRRDGQQAALPAIFNPEDMNALEMH